MIEATIIASVSGVLLILAGLNADSRSTTLVGLALMVVSVAMLDYLMEK